MFDLVRKADDTMQEHGFLTVFTTDEIEETASFTPRHSDTILKDLREFLWIAIDNATTRDMDQVQFVQAGDNGDLRLFIGIADVDERVPINSKIDLHAGTNTASSYTGIKTYHMLPEQLSTAATSLLPGMDRQVIVA